MPNRAEVMRLRRTLQRDRDRLESLLQLLVVESKLTPESDGLENFNSVIRRVQERFDQATADLRLCDAELGKL